jgi:hypothetical protein
MFHGDRMMNGYEPIISVIWCDHPIWAFISEIKLAGQVYGYPAIRYPEKNRGWLIKPG